MVEQITPFAKATAQQFEILIDARNRSGAHAYYSTGYDSSKERFELKFPSTFRNFDTFIVAFEFFSDERNLTSSMFLRKANAIDTYIQLSFSDLYEFLYIYDNNTISTKVNEITSPVKGFHVLEISPATTTFDVFIDGQRYFDAEIVKRDKEDMIHFYTAYPPKAQFIFWETHYTFKSVFITFSPKFAFEHKNLNIAIGGYVLFHAKWGRGDKINLRIDTPKFRDHILMSVSSGGETTCLLKMYEEGFVFRRVDDKNEATLFRKVREIPLDKMYIEPMPENIINLIIVTGDFLRQLGYTSGSDTGI